MYWDKSKSTHKGDESDVLQSISTGSGVVYPWVNVASLPFRLKLQTLGKLDAFHISEEDSFRVDDDTVQFFQYIVQVRDEEARTSANRKQVEKDLERLGDWVRTKSQRGEVARRIREVFLEPSDVRVPDYFQGMDQVVADWPHDLRGLRILLLALELLEPSGYASCRVLFRLQPGLNVTKTSSAVVPVFDSIVQAMQDRVEPTSILRLAKRVVDFAREAEASKMHSALRKRMQSYMGDGTLFGFHDTSDLHVVFRRSRGGA